MTVDPHLNSEQPILLSMREITKRFPGVLALDHVTLDIHTSEVHGLVGENGAGKSTLMKIMSGVYTEFEGQMRIAGSPSPSAIQEMPKSAASP